VAELVWKLATIAIMVWALRRYEGRRLDAATTGWASEDDGAPRPSRARVAIAGALLAGAVSAFIPNLVGLSSGSASAYGTVHKAGVALILAELLVRYPLTVFAEEAFFRGWLQPRLGRGGPALSAVLWGLYHLQQVKTIPQLIPYGVALGLLRWWRGNVRASAAVHYLGNVVFFLTNYA
jgi:membrane protease YdiL (CAAX protease family)